MPVRGPAFSHGGIGRAVRVLDLLGRAVGTPQAAVYGEIGLAKGGATRCFGRLNSDRHDAAQCGFCTPGILMSAEALLRTKRRKVSTDEIKEALAGNLCRCTGYTKILDAIVDASEQMYGPAKAEAARAG